MEKIPIIDMNEDNAKGKLNCELWSTGSNSDYRNDRGRPYNGQPHTTHGVRGETEVRGLTMRDISDCIVQGILAASTKEELQEKVVEIHDDMKGTEYASKNTWRYQDVYEVPDDTDPLAMVKCAMCFIEHYMGIFPNVDRSATKEVLKQLGLEEKTDGN